MGDWRGRGTLAGVRTVREQPAAPGPGGGVRGRADPGPGPGQDPASAGPDFNVAPTKPALVVLRRQVKDADGESATAPDGSDAAEDTAPAAPRMLRLLTWGLVPSWAKDRSVGSRMINARAA